MKRFLFLDPGFGFMGISVLEITKGGEKVVYMDVLQTEKSDAKRKVLAADDNLRRANEIYHAIDKLIDDWDISLICAESMSFPRNSSAAAKMAMSWGIVAALAAQYGISIVQASPQEIKKAVCGKKDASKDDVEAALRGRFPEAADLLPKDLAKGKHNHAWDSLAAGVTCLNSDLVKAILKFME